MTRVFRYMLVNRPQVLVSASLELGADRGEYSAHLCVGWVRGSHCYIVAFGWGWDDEMPLRPWPQVSRTPLPTSGRANVCITLLGFFFSWTPGSR